MYIDYIQTDQFNFTVPRVRRTSRPRPHGRRFTAALIVRTPTIERRFSESSDYPRVSRFIIIIIIFILFMRFFKFILSDYSFFNGRHCRPSLLVVFRTCYFLNNLN